MAVDVTRIRRVVEEVVLEHESVGSGFLQTKSVLKEAAQRLNIQIGNDRQLTEQQSVLDAWYALFAEGLLEWGYDLANFDPPHCHLTERGRRTLTKGAQAS